MSPEQSTSELALSFLFLGATSFLWVAVLLAGLVKWKKVRPIFRAGLVLGLFIFLFKLPGSLVSAYYLDIDSMMAGGASDALANAPESIRTGLKVGVWVGFCGALAFAFFGIFHTGLAVGVGQMAQSRAYPFLAGLPHRGEGWIISGIVGALGGVVSLAIFVWLDVGNNETMLWLMELMPGLASLPVVAQTVLALFTVTAYAIAEEVTFRGVLQGWLTRFFGGRTVGVVIAIVITSLVWALGHASNTDAIGVKLAQIFLLGLVFGFLARRYSVEATIVAHIGLNVVATIGGVLFLDG